MDTPLTLGSRPSHWALVVPRALVQQVKDALEGHGMLDKRIKITPFSASFKYELLDGDVGSIRESSYFISLSEKHNTGGSLSELVRLLQIQEHEAKMSLIKIFEADLVRNKSLNSQTNRLAQTIQCWLQQESCWTASAAASASVIKNAATACNWTYMVYPPMMLLPPSFLSNLSFISGESVALKYLPSLYRLICKDFDVERIALSAPIPNAVKLPSEPSKDPILSGQIRGDYDMIMNILRSPTGLTPLYGDFGPDLPLCHIPAESDFASAFWCKAQQNGITQIWAPRYVMFSRGNISEKARILNLKTLSQEKLKASPYETSAVDLYAGIGYFAFSYAKAGVGRVLCWEINPWSVEGLRRGAKANGWDIDMVRAQNSFDNRGQEHKRLVVFQESNECASARINSMRDSIPPVKHVNCGYLPSSKASWETAVQVLDPSGGWVHAHENVVKKDTDSRKEEIVRTFAKLAEGFSRKWSMEQWRVECEHVQQVKSYAPGVMHCVFDIAIMPTN